MNLFSSALALGALVAAPLDLPDKPIDTPPEDLLFDNLECGESAELPIDPPKPAWPFLGGNLVTCASDPITATFLALSAAVDAYGHSGFGQANMNCQPDPCDEGVTCTGHQFYTTELGLPTVWYDEDEKQWCAKFGVAQWVGRGAICYECGDNTIF